MRSRLVLGGGGPQAQIGVLLGNGDGTFQSCLVSQFQAGGSLYANIGSQIRAGLDGLIDSLLAAQHVLEMFRRALPNGTSRRRLDRLSNRLTKILSEARHLGTH